MTGLLALTVLALTLSLMLGRIQRISASSIAEHAVGVQRMGATGIGLSLLYGLLPEMRADSYTAVIPTLVAALAAAALSRHLASKAHQA